MLTHDQLRLRFDHIRALPHESSCWELTLLLEEILLDLVAAVRQPHRPESQMGDGLPPRERGDSPWYDHIVRQRCPDCAADRPCKRMRELLGEGS